MSLVKFVLSYAQPPLLCYTHRLSLIWIIVITYFMLKELQLFCFVVFHAKSASHLTASSTYFYDEKILIDPKIGLLVLFFGLICPFYNI